MKSVKFFEYNQLWEQIEDQCNNTFNTLEITNKYIVLQMKIQYSLCCVAQNCVIQETNLKYKNITSVSYISWISVVLSHLVQKVKFPIFTSKVIHL